MSESSLRRNLKLRDEDGIVFIPDTELFENLTLMGIVPFFDTMLVHQGKGSGTPTEPHHTPFPEAETSRPTTSSIPLPSIPTTLIPPVIQPDTTPIRQYTRRARIAQSSALLTIADEPASLVRDVSEREACPAVSGFIADQDRATIAKSSTLPYDSAPRVTTPAADEGKEEIVKLKERVKVLEDKKDVAVTQSRDDAPIKGRSINEEEAATERISNDSEEIARVLTSIDAATVLEGGIDVPTGSGLIPTAGPPATVISTGSEVGPTASLIVTRRRGKEVMVESDTLKKKKLQEQIDAQVARELEEQQEKENIRMNGQIARDAKVARIHAEEELQGMIDSLDKLNETIAKYLQEYQDFASVLPLEKRIELINLLKQLDREDLNQLWDLVKEYLSIRPATKWKLYDLSGVHHLTAKDREIFMLVEKDYPLRKGLTLVMISYKLQVENYSQMAEDLIRKIYNIANTSREGLLGIKCTRHSHCQVKSSHWQYKFPLPVKVVATARRLEMPLPEVCTAIEEKKKKLPVKDRYPDLSFQHRSAVMFLLPMPYSVSSASVLPLVWLSLVLLVLRSVIQPLLVRKELLADHKIGRQFCLLSILFRSPKATGREDLNQLWALVKEYLSIRPAINDKEMELWVELKRIRIIKLRGRLLGIKCTRHSHSQVKCSHWQYKFPLPVKVVATARRLEMPLPEVCTAIEEKKKKLPIKDRWQLH
nr:hypothetical protein [Tanacetum cinerariifolium]